MIVFSLLLRRSLYLSLWQISHLAVSLFWWKCRKYTIKVNANTLANGSRITHGIKQCRSTRTLYFTVNWLHIKILQHFRLENKACITHNKQTMKIRIELRLRNVETKTDIDSKDSRNENKRKEEKNTILKHEPTHKWVPFSMNVVVASISVQHFLSLSLSFAFPSLNRTMVNERTNRPFFGGEGKKDLYGKQPLSMRVQKHLKVSSVCSQKNSLL